MCRLGLCLSPNGELQLLAQCQRPDLVDREDGTQVRRSGGLSRPFRDGFQLLPAVEVEPPRRLPYPGVWPAALRPPPGAVEGMAWVPSAGRARHDGRQGIRGLAWEQGGLAVWRGRVCWEHGVEGLQAPVALLQVRDDPHLVVVAIPQHDHGDRAGVTFARRQRCVRGLGVARHEAREVAPPVTGGPAFPCCQAFVQRDTEGFGPRWRGGPLPAPGAGRGPGVRWRCYERVYPAQLWDPHAPLGWLEGIEPPDRHFNKVVGDLCPGGDECLELPHKDFGCCGVWQGDHGEGPVRGNVTEVFPEGCHQLARGCGRGYRRALSVPRL